MPRRVFRSPVSFLSVALCLFALGVTAPRATSQTIFTVNATDDVNDGACNETHCSLREAILASNRNGGGDIRFSIEGEAPFTIRPQSALPVVTASTSIDGTTQAGYAGMPMVELDGSDAGEVHGLELRFGSSAIRGLVINRFGLNGIMIASGSVANSIEGNFIGTDVTGTVAVGNGLHGVSVVRSRDNTVGGSTAAARNVISGNAIHGVELIYAGASGNLVVGNYIGTDVTGSAALGNTFGVNIADAAQNVVGGPTPAHRNVISGNSDNGVFLLGAGSWSNVVTGNFIGTDAEGLAAVGNGNAGVMLLESAGNTVGGTADGAGNLISGNLEGITFESASANVVHGNRIGTDVTGTLALPNRTGMLLLLSDANLIGGTEPGAGNVISGSTGYGIILGDPFGYTASYNLVRGNHIGTDVTGATAIPNEFGIEIYGDGNLIGGDDQDGATAGNVIAHNRSGGINIQSGVGNAVLCNSIHDNGGQGIDLGVDGRTPNDATDLDVGPNNRQNFPTFTRAYRGSTVLEGTLKSRPLELYRLEFFANETCSSQGERFLAATEVTTDGSGEAAFSVTLQEPLLDVGTFVTATATATDNSTSEFSECAVVAGFDVTLAEADVIVVRGQTATYEVQVGAVGGPYGGEVALACAGLPTGATCTFDPTSVLPGAEGATASLEVTTTNPDTPPGQLPFTVTGTSGSLEMSAEPTLTVTDFAVGLSSETLTITAGQSGTLTVMVSSEGGPFPDAVNLTCGGAPMGTSCGLSHTTVSPGQGGATSTLTLVTSAGAAVGGGAPGGPPPALPGVEWLWALAALATVILAVRVREVRPSVLAAGAITVILLAGACGGDDPVQPREPVTFTLTVEGTSGALTHAATASVTIRY